MDEQKIVQVGSALAYRGIPLQSAYCGAKHAIQGFCDSLRAEILHDKSSVKLTMVQLPGVNTPQFGWVKSRLANKAKPIGAVYQPEVAAEAICWAARHNRRELFVGWPAVRAILGNKVLPQYGDSVLSRIGYQGQQREGRPEDPERAHNLHEPVDAGRDHGAHGVFDEQARLFSPQLWATTHRGLVALATAGVAGVGVGLYTLLRQGRNGASDDKAAGKNAPRAGRDFPPGRTRGAAADSDHLVGALVACVAVIATAELARALRYLNVAAGAWIALAPFVLGGAPALAVASNVTVGLLLIGLSLPRGAVCERYGGWDRHIT